MAIKSALLAGASFFTCSSLFPPASPPKPSLWTPRTSSANSKLLMKYRNKDDFFDLDGQNSLFNDVLATISENEFLEFQLNSIFMDLMLLIQAKREDSMTIFDCLSKFRVYLERKKGKSDKLKAVCTVLKQENQELMRKNEKNGQIMERINKEKADLMAKLATENELKQQIEANKRIIETINKEKTDLMAKLAAEMKENKQKIDILQAKNRELVENFASEREIFESQIQSAHLEISSLENTFFDYKNRNAQLQSENAKVKNEVKSLNKTLEKQRKSSQDSCKQQLSAKEKLLKDALSEKNRLMEIIKTHENEMKTARNSLENLAKLETTLESVKKENAAFREKLKKYAEGSAVSQQEFQSVKKELEKTRKGKVTVDKQLLKARTELESREKEYQGRMSSLGGEVRYWQDRAELTCVVCLENARSTGLQPCGHVCVCDNCAGSLRACPMCRVQIVTRQKLYFS